jgi:galactonate dehydratase
VVIIRTPAPSTGTRVETIVDVSIRSIPVSAKTTWRHVVITTSDGRTGLGEYTLDGAVGSTGSPPDLDGIASRMISRLMGAKVEEQALDLLGPLALEDITRATVYSACSQAIVALCAEAQGLSVAQFLHTGGSRRQQDMYANINRRTEPRTPEGFRTSAQLAVASGFTAVKLAPFDGITPANCVDKEGRKLLHAGMDRIAAVRESVGPSVDIYIDCHWRFQPSSITALLPALQREGVAWLECPLPETVDSIPALRSLRAGCADHGMRLCGLETSIGWPGYEAYVMGGAYDVIMPDIKHAGGYRAILDIARRAADQGVAVSLHNPSGPIAHVASLQLQSILPGSERLEVQFDESPLFWEIASPTPPMHNSVSAVPMVAGLGISLTAPYGSV